MSPRRWFRQPVLHFFALGAAIFAVDLGVRRARAPSRDPAVITLSPQFLRGLAARERSRLGREPTTAELAAAREQWITEEALYREALALGLDRGDTVIRQRLIQKMEFVTEDDVEPPPPTDREVADFAAAHPGRFVAPPRVTLEHVFARDPGVIDALRRRLDAGEDPAALGDPFAAGRSFGGRTEAELARSLGPELARLALTAPPGRWVGPARSPFGAHLLRVTARAPGEGADLDAAREALVAARREAVRSRAVAAIRARYRVR